jgi:hypothetical protein
MYNAADNIVAFPKRKEPFRVAQANALPGDPLHLLEALAATWPAFSEPQQPLKTGILTDILDEVLLQNGGRPVLAAKFRIVLAAWTRAPAYLRRCVPGTARVDLYGAPTCTVTEREAVFARQVELEISTIGHPVSWGLEDWHAAARELWWQINREIP